jgi:hypothetical protein
MNIIILDLSKVHRLNLLSVVYPINLSVAGSVAVSSLIDPACPLQPVFEMNVFGHPAKAASLAANESSRLAMVQ